jgi:YihY family inner membrane protein
MAISSVLPKPLASIVARHPRTGKALKILGITIREFGCDNGTLMAASVAFYLLLSLVPLMAVGIFVLASMLGGSEGARDHVLTFLNSYIARPQQKAVRELLDSLIANRAGIGLGGLALLALTATGGFATLETAVNILWKAPNRNFLLNKLFALLMLVVIGGLFAVSVALSTLTQLATNFATQFSGLRWVVEKPVTQLLLGMAAPFLITGLMFSAIFWFFPNTRNKRFFPALGVGFGTALLWELFKQAYAFYSARAGDQSATYGALAGLAGLVMWIYYSATLILFGAKLTWVLNGCPRPDPIDPTGPVEHGPGSPPARSVPSATASASVTRSGEASGG